MPLTTGMSKRYLFCLLAAAWLTPQALLAGRIDPDNPPQGLFSDEWLMVMFNGQKAGHAHQTMSREQDVVTTRMIMTFRLGRGGPTVEMSTMESTRETVAGRPLSFENVQHMATFETSVRGRIREGQVEIESSQFGLTKTERVRFPPGALMSWGLYAEQLRRGFKEGLSYELAIYQPLLMADRAVTTRIEVGRRETIDLLGKAAQGTRVQLTMVTPMGSISGLSWMGDDGEMLRTEIQMPGLGSLVLLRSDKQTAIQQAPAPEFFVKTMVKAKKKIDRSAARTVRYRLRVTGPGEPLPELPTTGMQTPAERTGDSLELTVSRQDHKALKNAGLAPAGKVLAEYLDANLWINSDDPQVIAMAREAAGDAQTPYEIADRLRKYVTEVIEDKNLNVGFASAGEVCRNKEGDCSEHGVLLAALGRVHKIPSRVVIGLVYVPRFAGADDVFGFHMWTQFHLGGQWVDFDAAQGESDCNPTHIAIGTASLKNAALGDMVFAMLNVIGRLEIDVLEADPPTALTGK